MAELGTVERAYADGYAAAQHEIARLKEHFAKLNAQDAEINKRLRAALEEVKAMCDRGESHTWIARIVRKALANEVRGE